MVSISPRILGQRIRQLRLRRGFTQQDLAGNDYSKSYISAIEQGKTRPSLQALQRMASRLSVPAGTLLDPNAQGFVQLDPEAMSRRVRKRRGGIGGLGGGFDMGQGDFELARAELLINTGKPEEAAQILRPLIPADGADFTIEQRPTEKVYMLAAMATLGMGKVNEAIAHLQRGMQFAAQLGDYEGLERMRNLLGMAYYQAGQPLTALEHHRTNLEAVKSGVIRDPSFAFQVYNNLAAAYAAINEKDKALDTYKEAIERTADVYNLQRQADSLRASASAYAEQGNYALAREYAQRAISLYETVGSLQVAAQVENRYSEMLIQSGDFDAAEEYITNSLQRPSGVEGPNDKAMALTSLARIYKERGDLDQARDYAAQAIDEGRAAVREAPTLAVRYASPHCTLAMALALAGEIAVQQGNTDEADRMFNEAVKIIETTDAGRLCSDIYERYARMLASRGQHEQAAQYYERAYRAVTKR